MNLSTWIMNFLLMLSAFGNPLSPSDDAWEFDFNGNGFIDIFDIMDMLALCNLLPLLNLEFMKRSSMFTICQN